ncbi:bifunctional (p)ppGpp synthetase/guanosine-3',5'-bis(diphosphate) 3'-pyrophosphohydrolase [Marine Group I thaumarchaeote]|uniref:Bifunctional (P)ppGpp synthetase/guanosine-3',5'-bis(Diphosphate) 3'-pyrophosphohydrolase n=1 Tax=Marine Group I thaumarchaeote TaxID=2511932 RepID=A0A7K4MVZ1_9ARCH|nr:bifunctional (p)ppGpp synthetase/guanosine-3',5'-bis(diphosphate) 3'-pyrophosphohydrolase [Candidatus Nitrosopumilus sp. MTA1]NWJ57695.1 bifunctional (p)ppGpp synthetase/guanosine-3',5'-bis(diphosphate) 3'-pyrophosphohydrolase [Marine Group I thaumarchaeote]NWJ84632.1 bifunctional (p)ppGpp synthetase/guanosine-3',5'-bis(diphosphate) 3'-pyrophosphohydrolase [Marine Group I thaumarchaeote]NWK08033.1 bifunctional (p)ppGpp synthetase/guanosine-3',5'-bis(diphosphate) 3'-pyrophosphohydrolase [Marin
MVLELVKNAELFAKKKHSGQFRKDGITPYSKHLEDVVNRLKSLGVVDEELLCAGWLHDTIEDTDVTFDDLFEKYESRIAVLVSSLSKDMSLTRKKREKVYSKQLQEASFDAKLIKLCDISANLSDLKNYNASKSKKLRQVKQKRHYVNVIKNDLLSNTNYPKIFTLLESINQILKRYHQRPISLQLKIS